MPLNKETETELVRISLLTLVLCKVNLFLQNFVLSDTRHQVTIEITVTVIIYDINKLIIDIPLDKEIKPNYIVKQSRFIVGKQERNLSRIGAKNSLVPSVFPF